ncbi:MAG: energy-coupling factor transporter transmembrane protein EcfT [Candidatus Promineofilum sp.]|nr:energy-coupling factor transporter transmembrane protein EcfT [Promineifilum sp.]
MRTFDARAWVVWLLVGGVLVLTARNPLYLLLVLLISRLVHTACAPPGTGALRLPFWRLAAAILLFSTLFNLLTAHIGETVLATLPAHWWLIGGPLTLEAAVYGFITGLSLVTLLSLFLAFNAIVPTAELAGLTPAALYELGLVLLVALTYVPETVRQFQRIREAQAIRGHRLRGLRDWRPIAIPLLVGGLERALNLAETMVARGYGATVQVSVPRRTRLLLLLGLVLALGGALRLGWGAADGWALIATAALAIGLAYRGLSRGVVRTRYRARRWTWADTLVVVAALLPLALLWPLPGGGGLDYAPYPRLSAPPFSVVAGLLLLGLAAPAALEVAR